MKITGHERVLPCSVPMECGHPRGKGHPRAGWVNVRRMGESVWFCSWPCVVTWAAVQAVKTGEVVRKA